MSKIEYDDSQLRKLFSVLTERERVKAMRGAYRAAAKALKKEAVNQLASASGAPRNARRIGQQAISASVYSKKAGFYVSVGAKYWKKGGAISKAVGYYLNSQGQAKPIGLWFNLGSKNERRTRDKGVRGRIPQLDFMGKAKAAKEASISNELQERLKEYIVKESLKHGCK